MVRAVKDHRQQDNLLTGVKEYDLSEFVKKVVGSSLSYRYCHDFVLGIQSDDMAPFLKYLDVSILKMQPTKKDKHVAALFQNDVRDLANFILARPNYIHELEIAGFHKDFLQQLENFVFANAESTEEDV